MRRTSLAVLILSTMAAAQTPTADRVFQFEHTDAVQNFMEVSTLIRTMTDVPRVTTDESQKTLELRGTADQLALADWLFHQLDRPPASDLHAQSSDAQFTMSSGNDNLVRIFYLASTPDIRSFQEVATLIRTIGDIRRVFTYNAPRAFVVRGDTDQMALAEWLVNQIEHPAAGTSQEYRMPVNSDPRGDTVVRLFHVANTATIQDFQELATAIRTIADIRRVFTYNGPRTIAVRATAEQIPLAEWLIQQLDKSAVGYPGAPAVASSGVYNYQTRADPDNIIRVFYLHNPTVEDFQHTATQVRTKTGIRRVFTCNASRSMAARGTVDQIAMAERMLKEMDAH